jgi:predicted ArsR family transcriptional regulator
VYQELAARAAPGTTGDLAGRVGLHPNTVRLHLEKLRDAGLAQSVPDRHGTVGRPQHLWSLRSTSPSLGLEPAGMRLLAHLLADLAASKAANDEDAAGVGRRFAAEQAGVPRAGATGVQPCLRAIIEQLIEQLAALGFEPTFEPTLEPSLESAPEPGSEPGSEPAPEHAPATVMDLAAAPPEPAGQAATEPSIAAPAPERAVISFARCPFRELAAVYPDLICELHRGITEGILEASGPGARLDAFSTLVDPDPCRAEVSVPA